MSEMITTPSVVPAPDVPAEADNAPEAAPVPSWLAAVTPSACTVVDRSWWAGRYAQWDTSTVGRVGVPRAVLKFARLAENAGWAVAIRAGSHYPDDDTSWGVWEVEASGRCHDNHGGGQADAVLSLMWVQKRDGGRWMFSAGFSGAEIGGRLLDGIRTLAEYERAARIARPVKVDRAAEARAAAEAAAAAEAERVEREAAERAEYIAIAAEHARSDEGASTADAERFGVWVADSDMLWLGDFARAWEWWRRWEAAPLDGEDDQGTTEAPAAPASQSVGHEPRAKRAEARAVVLEAQASELGDMARTVDPQECPGWATYAAERAAETAMAADGERFEARLARQTAADQAEQVERARKSAAATLARQAGTDSEGRTSWRSADGRSVMVLRRPEHYPSPEAQERTQAYADVLAAAVAAKDAGQSLTGRDYGKQAQGYPGPGSEVKRAVTRSCQPLATAWKAPRLSEDGKPLSDALLCSMDAVGDMAETQTAPGVWLPMLAVKVAERAVGNGWGVAVERRTLATGRALVIVRFAGTVTRKALDGRTARVTGDGVAVWTDGRYDVLRSGAFVAGHRLGPAAVDQVLTTLGQSAEPASVTTGGEPCPYTLPDAGPGDPGTVDGWEDDGGVVRDKMAVGNP
ncbi:hypothetical protein ACXZ65_37980 [Streptomyces aculeolatus]